MDPIPNISKKTISNNMIEKLKITEKRKMGNLLLISWSWKR